MLTKTHIALGAGVALYFLPHINNKLLFVTVVLISSLLPDIGTIFKEGNKKLFSFPGKASLSNAAHSYTICIPISIIFALFYPVLALPFFLGYSFHLALDAFNTDGIQLFWPAKNKSSGHISPGGRMDKTIFFIFVLFDIALLIKLFI
jgi:membrane-bound metal-dependent hydrolase YbcI (DUF457 family)